MTETCGPTDTPADIDIDAEGVRDIENQRVALEQREREVAERYGWTPSAIAASAPLHTSSLPANVVATMSPPACARRRRAAPRRELHALGLLRQLPRPGERAQAAGALVQAELRWRGVPEHAHPQLRGQAGARRGPGRPTAPAATAVPGRVCRLVKWARGVPPLFLVLHFW